MLKKRNVVVAGVVAFQMFCWSCQKSDMQVPHLLSQDRVIEVTSDGKTSNDYYLNTQIGHDGKDCPGCVLCMGKMIHKDCMRYGRYCRMVAKVQFDTVAHTATTVDTFDLTSEDFFAMPDRSLYFEDDNKDPFYLNIPEQLVYRDSTTLQFTFTGLYITSSPAYSND